MDQGFRFLCQAETRRLLLVLGIAFSLVLVVQYFELPYGRVLSSLFSTGSFPTGDSSSMSEIVGNVTILNISNSSRAVNDHERATNVDNFRLVSNGTSVDNLVELNKSVPAPEKVMELEHTISLKNGTNNNSSVIGTQVEEENGSSDVGLAFPSFASPPGSLPNITHATNLDEKSKSNNSAKKKMSKRPPTKVVSISEMNNLLLQSRASSLSLTPQWLSNADREVLSAKSQIENAPVIENDELYAPLYRNVSMFKRSYVLMEDMLKVYIYREGEKPIFHQSILQGIYASEGWFLKLMEANKKFVTKDPGKAHLFYLPFSSRLLELTLYKRHSHKRKNLIQYMKNYVAMIGAKYPFWNRTGGADHFLAACHDWAPAETRGHMLNCIRALCNADIDVGFSIGKDVSLPETYVRSAENPDQALGGNPPSDRPILAFFAGGMHGYVRPILLNYWGNKDPDMKIFGQMPHVKGNTNYIQHMKSSKYCICAKGYEVNSPRVVEAIFYECVPVIISDNYVPPFFEVLNWESFAVFVLENDIPNLKEILLSISEERYKEMHIGVKKVQQHFLWHAEPLKYDLFHMILHSVWYNRLFRIRPL